MLHGQDAETVSILHDRVVQLGCPQLVNERVAVVHGHDRSNGVLSAGFAPVGSPTVVFNEGFPWSGLLQALLRRSFREGFQFGNSSRTVFINLLLGDLVLDLIHHGLQRLRNLRRILLVHRPVDELPCQHPQKPQLSSRERSDAQELDQKRRRYRVDHSGEESDAANEEEDQLALGLQYLQLSVLVWSPVVLHLDRQGEANCTTETSPSHHCCILKSHGTSVFAQPPEQRQGAEDHAPSGEKKDEVDHNEAEVIHRPDLYHDFSRESTTQGEDDDVAQRLDGMPDVVH
mmetsp:Transcript_55164/g.119162  ORF Transcript_55164/g.119162 Transcript_55164/m.119162 type:complete len:288 (+) Transcript_55164:1582-2445(+)